MWQELLDNLEAIGEGIATLVESIFGFIEWIPLLSNVFGGAYLMLLPSSLFAVAGVIMTIYLLKIIVGGENK